MVSNPRYYTYIIHHIIGVIQESDTIRRTEYVKSPASPLLGKRSLFCRLLICIVIGILLAVPVLAESPGTISGSGTPHSATAEIGLYVVDFTGFSVADGTVTTTFYLSIRSDANLSVSDFEIPNGRINSVDTLTDTSALKTYRVFAVVNAEPDLRYFPFDTHTIPIMIEPKTLDRDQLVMKINLNQTGLDSETIMPGWAFTSTEAVVTNRSYGPGEVPFPRAVFSYGIMRNNESTLLKFFLPLFLIILVSLASLLMKETSRLGLNASMLLAAVLIHWRIADTIPLVSYATFQDIFMIITYATLVMVLISGILIMKYHEQHDTVRADQISYWSLRIIPFVSLVMYSYLFLTLPR